jgi:hypothetical protein
MRRKTLLTACNVLHGNIDDACDRGASEQIPKMGNMEVAENDDRGHLQKFKIFIAKII